MASESHFSFTPKAAPNAETSLSMSPSSVGGVLAGAGHAALAKGIPVVAREAAPSPVLK